MIARAAVAALATVLLASGCGLQSAGASSTASVTVTRDFGAARVGYASERSVPAGQTVARFLQANFKVTTRDDGRQVASVDGQPSSPDRGDWFYYVNGIAASLSAARTPVHAGDQIWWDLHDPSASNSIPAVVGSFPEPFVHGSGGRRLPTVIQCGNGVSSACNRVTSVLAAAGVRVAEQFIGTGSGTDSLTVEVGTWSQLQGEIVAALLRVGPSQSGVYARFTGPGGRALALLNGRGQVVKTLGSGAGLIAATAQGSAPPTWLITGTDARGVSAAARTLTAAALRDRFAVALQDSTELPLPLDASR